MEHICSKSQLSSLPTQSADTKNVPNETSDLNRDLTNLSSHNVIIRESNEKIKNSIVEDVEMKSMDNVLRVEQQISESSVDQKRITCAQLADCLTKCTDSSVYHILIDTRSFIEYNSCHIQEAVNVCCSKIIKRRLQNDKTTVRELLNNVNNGTDLDKASLIVVYDQGSPNVSSLADDGCLKVLWTKLISTFSNVRFLSGGFSEFNQKFNALCTNKAQMLQNHQKKPSIDAIGQPCLPNIGPTRILPFLYLGSQVDAMNQELLKNHNITYELNVSTTCPKPDFIQDSHFLRIPVNDNYSDKLLPHFPKAINFLDKVRESSGCVLVHCLGGISRSATVAIAYIMQHMKMTSDDAYRYVKGKRATISPNFNFLGQLLEYEKQLIVSSILPAKSESSLLRMSKERLEKGETDFHPQLTPSICDLNNKTFSSSSPKHHVLHHHFNPHLMNPMNQKSIQQPQDQSIEQAAEPSSTSHSASTNLNTNQTSQFTNLNSNLNANGAQKRTCSFSSSPNTRNKMTLKLSTVSDNDNLGSILFMWV